jgi:NTE family protein
MIALALSGGGFRAMAFHLGCLRALHGRGLLEKVSVISAVSGGAIIAAMYAYSDEPFEDFDKRVVTLLRNGLQHIAVLHLFSPVLLLGILATNLISRPAAIVARGTSPLRRWFSRSDAFESALEGVFGRASLKNVKRPKIDVIFNACELRTGTAFRFGNHRSGSWRLGEIENNDVSLAHAVACSAAYPLAFPAFDRDYTFVKNGATHRHRVIITDGGVYDNLGISCIEPGRDSRFNLHTYKPDHIICCNAGYGQLSGNRIPFGMYSRMTATFEANFRKVQDASMHRLHMHKYAGDIKGFILPYLGQNDNALPFRPDDLISRDQVIDYPTDLAAMPDNQLALISERGEQLTHLLLTHYCPEL